MHKALYFIGLASIALSCTTQKYYYTYDAKSKNKNNPSPNTVIEKPKPSITHQGEVEFFTQNIANPAKNDNTISYGSLVSAKPKGYKVTKNFFPAMGQNFRQRYLILHYTALDETKSVAVLSQQAVSAHYLVNDLDNNEIFQLVDENKRAYHAGVSRWRNDYNLNDASIGIEIVNMGFKTDASGKKVFVGYSDAQIKKVAALVKDIADRYMIAPTNILGHSDIAPTRKQDPGPLFPWKKLYDEYQIGMWYDDATMKNFLTQINPEEFNTQVNTSPFIFKVQTALQQFGYDIVPSGTWDKNNTKVVEAFQYHFRPSLYDGKIDMETWAILQALNQKYSK
ncbi:MAG: N-acetylmuramoyl-L-alanine amidase [Bacteroidetes bacterium]|nr:N-acetylmuramoyl-L-alanine amidase [Bacteroidota bacterium]